MERRGRQEVGPLLLVRERKQGFLNQKNWKLLLFSDDSRPVEIESTAIRKRKDVCSKVSTQISSEGRENNY